MYQHKKMQILQLPVFLVFLLNTTVFIVWVQMLKTSNNEPYCIFNTHQDKHDRSDKNNTTTTH